MSSVFIVEAVQLQQSCAYCSDNDVGFLSLIPTLGLLQVKSEQWGGMFVDIQPDVEIMDQSIVNASVEESVVSIKLI